MQPCRQPPSTCTPRLAAWVIMPWCCSHTYLRPFRMPRTLCNSAQPHARTGRTHARTYELLHKCVVRLLLALRHDGQCGTVQHSIPSHSTAQRSMCSTAWLGVDEYMHGQPVPVPSQAERTHCTAQAVWCYASPARQPQHRAEVADGAELIGAAPHLPRSLLQPHARGTRMHAHICICRGAWQACTWRVMGGQRHPL